MLSFSGPTGSTKPLCPVSTAGLTVPAIIPLLGQAQGDEEGAQ